MEAVIPPAWKESQHTHPPYAMYIVNGGKVRMHSPDGTTRDADLNTGEAIFSDKVTHWAENIGADTVKVILVELRHR
jgi:quercetin dioxygenase-like cupin family protein